MRSSGANVSEAESQLICEQQELSRLQLFLDQLDNFLNGIAQSAQETIALPQLGAHSTQPNA
jgi:hypothetical protein